MTWSIRGRLTAWYSLLVVVVLVAGAAAVVVVEDRLALERLDGELERLMLTLEGVMRTEFSEGLTLQGAADEASIEVVAPDRTLVLTEPDGDLLAVWGRPIAAAWRYLYPEAMKMGSACSKAVLASRYRPWLKKVVAIWASTRPSPSGSLASRWTARASSSSSVDRAKSLWFPATIAM